MKVDTTYYEKRFSIYPDLVDLLTFRKMLGGIGDTFARRLIRENRVKYIFVRPRYWISKKSIIHYLLSADYASRRLKVRV